ISTPSLLSSATSRRPCGVRTNPGQTALQRMFWSRYSTAIERANIWQAPFDVLETTSLGVAAMAEIDEVQTIDPPPAAIIPGSTALVMRNMLVTLTAISHSQSASVVSRKGLMTIEPA